MAVTPLELGSMPSRTHEENSADIRLAQAAPGTPEARAAFGRVIEAYRGSLYAMSLAQTHDPQRAEELAQSVAVHAMEKLGQLRDPRAFAGWLRRMTHRMAINVLTRGGREYGAEEGMLEAIAGPDDDPGDALLSQERTAELHDAMLELGDLDRETLEAFYLRGRSLKQMAREFDAPVGTIKRRLHVARGRLKELLGESEVFAQDGSEEAARMSA